MQSHFLWKSRISSHSFSRKLIQHFVIHHWHTCFVLIIFQPTEGHHKNLPFPDFRICTFSGFDLLGNQIFIFMLEDPCEVLWVEVKSLLYSHYYWKWTGNHCWMGKASNTILNKLNFDQWPLMWAIVWTSLRCQQEKYLSRISEQFPWLRRRQCKIVGYSVELMRQYKILFPLLKHLIKLVEVCFQITEFDIYHVFTNSFLHYMKCIKLPINLH